MSNPIQAENLNTGSTGWSVSNYAPTYIAAYVDKTSYNAGDTVNFYASVQTVGTYTLNIYRLGWYSGAGGRLVATINNTGVAQGWFDAGGGVLHNNPTAVSNGTTQNWEAGWAVTETWTIPANACIGMYVGVYTLADGSAHQGAIHFIVKGNTSADYVYIGPFCTDQAYNQWGSNQSLYTNVTVSAQVSFNRPYYAGYGCMTLYEHQVQLIHWLESQNYNLSYLSDIDYHVTPSLLLNYKCMLFAAHDEYWSKTMYDGVQAALAAGVNIGNMGANNCYWQIRLDTDIAGGTANRTVTCYKVQTQNSNLALDPQYGINNALVTTQWRDPFLNRPENALWGIMWSGDVNWPGLNVPWTVANGAPATYLNGTGLAPGTSYGTDCVGYEWDKIWPNNGFSPKSLQVIATSLITNKFGTHDISQTTIYTASSGALVFSSGSINFAYALDGYRYNASSVATTPQMQALMVNIMAVLAVKPRTGPVFSMVGI